MSEFLQDKNVKISCQQFLIIFFFHNVHFVGNNKNKHTQVEIFPFVEVHNLRHLPKTNSLLLLSYSWEKAKTKRFWLMLYEIRYIANEMLNFEDVKLLYIRRGKKMLNIRSYELNSVEWLKARLLSTYLLLQTFIIKPCQFSTAKAYNFQHAEIILLFNF